MLDLARLQNFQAGSRGLNQVVPRKQPREGVTAVGIYLGCFCQTTRSVDGDGRAGNDGSALIRDSSLQRAGLPENRCAKKKDEKKDVGNRSSHQFSPATVAIPILHGDNVI